MLDSEELTMIDVIAYQSSTLEERLIQTENDLHHELVKKHIASVTLVELKNSIPDFKADLDWFNVTEPLSLTDNLRGKVVVLDFFTYCCINCMHILPDLKAIESKFTPEDGLVVLGVHSAKFSNEKDSANILSAIQRYGIMHPIVNDVGSSLWQELNITCWPTLLILGPNANPLFVLMGEGHGLLLQKYVTATLEFYKEQGLLSTDALPLSPSIDLIVASNLRFPAKIANFNETDLFAVSDSGNNRILLIDSDGNVLEKVGGNVSGFTDGSFEVARFNSPQGIAFINDHVIFVADTDNHAIRKIDLKSRSVETIVGNGKQGNDRAGGKKGVNQEISSPWDVSVYRTRDMDMSFHIDEKVIPEKVVILIAMAGNHQIWGYFVDDTIWWKFKKFEAQTCVALIGNGSEENRNNSYPQNAAFAQPSGLFVHKEFAYIADSESSSIRKASLIDGKVMAVAGGDRNPLNLFAYGDIDGKMFSAKLQHPLGITVDNTTGLVYVADTYNHKIKVIDPISSTVQSMIVKDHTDTIYQFNEPGGLCTNRSNDCLYIADTNNHCIQVIDLKTTTTKKLNLKFPNTNRPDQYAKRLKMNCFNVSKKGPLQMCFAMQLEDSLKLTANAPQKWFLELPTEDYSAQNVRGNLGQHLDIAVDINIPMSGPINSIIKLFCDLNFCNSSACFPKKFCIEIPIKLCPHSNSSNCLKEDVKIFISNDGICF